MWVTTVHSTMSPGPDILSFPSLCSLLQPRGARSAMLDPPAAAGPGSQPLCKLGIYRSLFFSNDWTNLIENQNLLLQSPPHSDCVCVCVCLCVCLHVPCLHPFFKWWGSCSLLEAGSIEPSALDRLWSPVASPCWEQSSLISRLHNPVWTWTPL